MFPDALVSSAHAYFGPLGLALLIVGVAAVQATIRTADRLERDLSRLRATLLGGPEGVDDSAPTVGRPIGFTRLVLVLWVAQLVLYVTMENLEARAFGLPTPGMGALAGVHALAPLVHLLVAGVMAGIVWLTHRRVTDLATEVGLVTDVLHRRDRCQAGPGVQRCRVRAWTPRQRWGAALWARPPPGV
jgi:hypothetical protein